MRSYKPEELFDSEGHLIPELKALAPKGNRRMSANPIANGGLVRKPLDMPDFRNSAVQVKKPGATSTGNVPTLGNFLRDVMRRNMDRFRVFGPDETQSNRLEAIYEVAKKVWLGEGSGVQRQIGGSPGCRQDYFCEIALSASSSSARPRLSARSQVLSNSRKYL